MKELFEIQQRIGIVKGSKNEFGGFRYYTFEDQMRSALPILKDLRCCLEFTDEIYEMGGARMLRATVTLRNVDTLEGFTTCGYAEICAHKGMSAEQCIGTASTYARKYAMNALLAVNGDRDPDSLDNSGTGAKPRRKAAPKLSEANYRHMVESAALGKSYDGGSIRDFYIKTYSPSPDQVARFDEDVDAKYVSLRDAAEAEGRLI
ncbi:MAG: ERF family protein [Prevotellaceae bacterium]|nr:ERF family protein [Prevotellaceae bacterium]